MSTFSAPVEEPISRIKPVKRLRGLRVPIALVFPFLQAASMTLLCTVKEKPMIAAARKYPYVPPTSTPCTSSSQSPSRSELQPQLDNIFIDALVQASSCRQHAPRASPNCTTLSNSTHLYHRPRRRQIYDTGRQTRHIHRNIAPPRSAVLRKPLTREEYMSMLDFYREPFSTQAMFPEIETPQLPPILYAPRAGVSKPRWDENAVVDTRSPPRNLPPLDPEEENRNQYTLGMREGSTSPLVEPPLTGVCGQPPEMLPSTDPDNQSCHSALRNFAGVLYRDDCTHEEAFEAYSKLPSPGVSHLSYNRIRLLFRRLSAMEKKDKDSQLRYLSVVDDMKACDLPLREVEWNSAIAFCGQCFARIKAAEVESALRTWNQMEQEACVKSGNVTFNILFDMAAKAGKFVLAEMILTEMEARKLSINRYARVGFIYYHGLRGDGDAVRKAYQEFVEAGEIVDTVVMNCVIASLIRAGEPSAAEQVYERMKRMLAKHTGHRIPSLNWKERRDLGRLLDRVARQFKNQPSELQQVRDKQLLAPDLHTYAIFVEHHATKTGELRRIATLLTEMQHLGIPMHGRIFLKLFKGFAYNGGLRYTSWTKIRLESVWNSLVDILDQETEVEVRIMKWMVIWSVRAFERCAGRERTLEIWEELRRRWRPERGEVEEVMGVLRDILKVGEEG